MVMVPLVLCLTFLQSNKFLFFAAASTDSQRNAFYCFFSFVWLGVRTETVALCLAVELIAPQEKTKWAFRAIWLTVFLHVRGWGGWKGTGRGSGGWWIDEIDEELWLMQCNICNKKRDHIPFHYKWAKWVWKGFASPRHRFLPQLWKYTR